MRRGPKFAEAMVPVPARFAGWEFEYRLGYNDGLTRKGYAWSPSHGTIYHAQRQAAYRAGRRDGKKARGKNG